MAAPGVGYYRCSCLGPEPMLIWVQCKVGQLCPFKRVQGAPGCPMPCRAEACPAVRRPVLACRGLSCRAEACSAGSERAPAVYPGFQLLLLCPAATNRVVLPLAGVCGGV
jgi:hypothetical protein